MKIKGQKLSSSSDDFKITHNVSQLLKIMLRPPYKFSILLYAIITIIGGCFSQFALANCPVVVQLFC
jgi:hypothetical protein